MPSIFDSLDSVLQRYTEIEEALARPEIATDFEQVQALAKERASLEDLVDISRQHQKLTVEKADLQALLEEGADLELTDMAKEELDGVQRGLGGVGALLDRGAASNEPQ